MREVILQKPGKSCSSSVATYSYWWTLSYGWCTTSPFPQWQQVCCGLHGLFYEVACHWRSNHRPFAGRTCYSKTRSAEQLLSDRGAYLYPATGSVGSTHLDTTRNVMDWWKSSMEHSPICCQRVLASTAAIGNLTSPTFCLRIESQYRSPLKLPRSICCTGAKRGPPQSPALSQPRNRLSGLLLRNGSSPLWCMVFGSSADWEGTRQAEDPVRQKGNSTKDQDG